MTKIVGYIRKTGEFEKDGKKIAYDNFNVFYTTDENAKVVGLGVGECKCPVSKLRILGADSLDDCIGRDCSLFVDASASQYKNSIPVVTTIICGD